MNLDAELLAVALVAVYSLSFVLFMIRPPLSRGRIPWLFVLRVPWVAGGVGGVVSLLAHVAWWVGLCTLLFGVLTPMLLSILTVGLPSLLISTELETRLRAAMAALRANNRWDRDEVETFVARAENGPPHAEATVQS